ncbi:MAG TPA: hypothetical protein VMU94_18290 [Streptosporangiaceae bacterium]|nr:hypothetical protein [Streptosporangiaceae bacterium]
MPLRMRSAAIAAVLAVTMASGLAQTAASAAERSPAFSGREVFKIVGRMPGPRHASVSAWGAFKATGVFIRKDATLAFRRGRIIVRRHVAQTVYYGPDLSTCRFKIVQKGTFVVTKATGRYRGLHESGQFSTTVSGRLVRRGPGRCGSKITAKRTVTYETGTVR